jgi:DGQHR domain-containing protein
MLPGKEVSGLAIRVPAVKTRMGGSNCYTFSISPEYLLKISYVSHRSKGKASDINAYQRMLQKSRLNKIKKYITEDGIFPTNIIVNFEAKRLNFQKIKQEIGTTEDADVGILGWLDIKPAYKSAWIIDGQHRLFSYSGHEKAKKSKLSVLAFEGLKPSMQAQLFIDINAKQKSVKQSLLQELFAELNWDSDKIGDRISAIISKAVQDINADPESPLFNRIQKTDGNKSDTTCISLNTLFKQIEKKDFYILKERNGSIIEYGPLWSDDDNIATLKRTKKIINSWLSLISEPNKEWWDIGSGQGGGLSMNDGIASFLEVLRSVFELLESNGTRLVSKTNEELCELIQSYGAALGEYIRTFYQEKRKRFRDLRGIAGVTYRFRQCQEGIRKIIPDFNPNGLNEWISLQKQETNKEAKDLIDKIEVFLQKNIIEELKSEYQSDNEDTWWYEGIPATIRSKATLRAEEDKNRRGGREFYFDLIDYRKIISENWELFEKNFGYGKGGKEKRTDWIADVNEIRKIVAHASSGKTVSLEDHDKVVAYYNWLISSADEDNLE